MPSTKWLDTQDLEEWFQDPLVERLADQVKDLRRQALKRLRLAARNQSLDEVRRAEQRVHDMDEFLEYLIPDVSKLEAEE